MGAFTEYDHRNDASHADSLYRKYRSRGTLPFFQILKEKRETVRMRDLDTAFQIIQRLGIAILPADIRTLQGLGARTVAMKTATKHILKQLIKERRTLN
jgi:hypothetical protein